MDAAPLFFGLGLEAQFGDVLDEGACDTCEEVLLDYFAGAHTFAEHEELTFI